MTRVRYIGRVEVGAADYGSTTYMDHSNASTLLVYAEPGANSLAVEHEVLATVQELKKDFLAGVDSIYDPTIFIANRCSTSQLEETGAGSCRGRG